MNSTAAEDLIERSCRSADEKVDDHPVSPEPHHASVQRCFQLFEKHAGSYRMFIDIAIEMRMPSDTVGGPVPRMAKSNSDKNSSDDY